MMSPIVRVAGLLVAAGVLAWGLCKAYDLLVDLLELRRVGAGDEGIGDEKNAQTTGGHSKRAKEEK